MVKINSLFAFSDKEKQKGVKGRLCSQFYGAPCLSAKKRLAERQKELVDEMTGS